MNDEDLLRGFGRLVRQDNQRAAELLRHIGEIDRRKLWARYGHPSMFDFCVDRFHMSEAVAGKRIGAARVAGRFPVIFEMVARGELHLSGVLRLKPHLTDENHRAVLGEAKHMTIKRVEALVARIAPRPDQPSRIRKLPERRPASSAGAPPSPGHADGTAEEQPSLDLSEDTASASIALPAPPAPARTARRAQDPEPLSPRRFKLEVTISEEARGQLAQFQGLLAHQLPDGDPAAIVEKALGVLVEQTLRKKAALTNSPRQPKVTAKRNTRSRRSRAIPAHVRRTVWERDEGRCGFVGEDGQRCGTTRCLEFAHVEPYGKGGQHTARNLGLRCRAHNAYEPDRDYGALFMAAKRRPPEGVRETLAAYLPESVTVAARAPARYLPRGLRTDRTAHLRAGAVRAPAPYLPRGLRTLRTSRGDTPLTAAPAPSPRPGAVWR